MDTHIMRNELRFDLTGFYLIGLKEKNFFGLIKKLQHHFYGGFAFNCEAVTWKRDGDFTIIR